MYKTPFIMIPIAFFGCVGTLFLQQLAYGVICTVLAATLLNCFQFEQAFLRGIPSIICLSPIGKYDIPGCLVIVVAFVAVVSTHRYFNYTKHSLEFVLFFFFWVFYLHLVW